MKKKTKPQFPYSYNWMYVIPQIMSELVWMSGKEGQKKLTKKDMANKMRWLVYIAAENISQKELRDIVSEDGIWLEDKFFDLLKKKFAKKQ